MIVVLHSDIVDGAVPEYLQAHFRVPDDLAAAFVAVNIRNWTIWRSGRRLFHLVECDDFDKAMSKLHDDPANRKWQKIIGPLVDIFRDGDGNEGSMPLPIVWSLAVQKSQAIASLDSDDRAVACQGSARSEL